MMSGAIMVLDDNEANLRVIAAVLKTRGYRLIEATSGESALAAIEDHQPALVLIDEQMPGMSGINVARAVRKLPATAALPLIATRAMAMKGDREEILAAGFNDYLAKPYKMADLLSVVSRWLPAG
jgi:two-component system cell cycle response regulator DivK